MSGRLTAGLAAAAVLLAGCGSSSLSASQMHARATRICNVTRARTNRIPTPSAPSQGTAFLSRGIAALAPELTALRRLRAPGDLAGDYRRALDASAAELAALRSSLKGLRAGNDPLVAIKTLEAQLEPAEAQATAAWSAADLPACQGS